MRTVPPALQAKLDAGATTLCACWRIDPVRGAPLGFTDHDAAISFDGVVFEAEAGIAAADIERELGLSIDNSSAAGALRSTQISEAEIRRGRFDGAEVRLWLVDWTDPDLRLLQFRGEVGEIRRGALAFEVELRGLAERLNRPVGRSFLQVCDAALGDARCGVNADDPAYRGTGAVLEVRGARTLLVSGLDGFEADWFTFGAFTWSDGPLAETTIGVSAHRRDGAAVEIELDAEFAETPALGAAFSVLAGCDKRVATCREKFGNIRNFRGFPYIPGESWMGAYPVEGGVYDGGSLVGS